MEFSRQLAGKDKLRDNPLDRACYTSCSHSRDEQSSAAENVKDYEVVTIELLRSEVSGKLRKCI